MLVTSASDSDVNNGDNSYKSKLRDRNKLNEKKTQSVSIPQPLTKPMKKIPIKNNGESLLLTNGTVFDSIKRKREI